MIDKYGKGINDGYLIAKFGEFEIKLKELLMRNMFPLEWIQHMELSYHGGYCDTCDAFYRKLQKLTIGDNHLFEEINKLLKEIIEGIQEK